MPYKNGTKLCICEICNCGRHRCPHHPTVKAPSGPCTISEYSNKYIPHPIHAVQSCKPAAVAMASKGPLSDETTTRVDYIPHPLAMRTAINQQEPYRAPEGRMEGDTVYSTTYTEKHAPKAALIKHEPQRRNLGRFEGEPTYRNDYRKWPLTKPVRVQTAVTWNPPGNKFDGIPTYTSDYIGHQWTGPPASCKPHLVALQSDKPFEDNTDYRQSYVKHPLEPRRALQQQREFVRPTVPFEGLTTVQRDYTPKAGGRSVSCRPVLTAHRSNAPLDSDTTNRIDYRPWELGARPSAHVPEAYRAPEGAFDGDTTYLRDYPRHAMGYKVQSTRPVERGRELGPFQGTTDYRDSYQRWKVQHRLPAGPQTLYRSPSVPFEGESTHHAHFIEHPLDPRKSCKPIAGRHSDGGLFDDATIYRTEYTMKASEPCPAALLETPRTRFIYREQDNSTGHKFYEPIMLGTNSSSLTDLRTGQKIPVEAC